MDRPLVLFVDIDDTLVRSFGSKRIPMTSVIERVRALHAEGAVLYGWSSGGADYARATVAELALADCFVAYLPKPDVFVDDVRIEAWRGAVQLHPNELAHRDLRQLRELVTAPRR
ncbi:MAG: hydrolase [Myxococcota bacterium]